MIIEFDVQLRGTADTVPDAETIAMAIEDALMQLEYDCTAIVDEPEIEED